MAKSLKLSADSFQLPNQSKDTEKTVPFSSRSHVESVENTVLQMATSQPLKTQQLVLPTRLLSIEDIGFIKQLGTIEGETFTLKTSPKGYHLKTPVTVSLTNILALQQRGLADYILSGLSSQRPRLIPIILENRSMVELARHLLRRYSGSPLTLYTYCNDVVNYAQRLQHSPDGIIADATAGRRRIDEHRKFLEAHLADLQDAGRSPGRLHSFAKAVRTWYRVNGIQLQVQNIPRPRPVNKDRAPTQQEVARLDLLTADLRCKFVLAALCLGGFREQTLASLEYHHVKEDLESGVTPVHIHVEAEITKGHYADYDTFLGHDAVEYLKEYLSARRKGIRILATVRSPGLILKPEEIRDDSPLLRDEQHYRRHRAARPISRKQVYQIVHQLYFKAGLIETSERSNSRSQYSLRVHSLRKFFKTNLVTKGIPEPIVDYMMGHVTDTYTDIQSQGVEHLRQLYSGAALSIHPRSEDSQLINSLIQQLKAAGRDPEKYLRKEALSEPHGIVVRGQYSQEEQARALLAALRDYVTDGLAARS